MGEWLTQDTVSGIQVIPLDDTILHTHNGCPCNPRIERHGTTCYCGDGPKLLVRTVTVHHAIDGRD